MVLERRLQVPCPPGYPQSRSLKLLHYPIDRVKSRQKASLAEEDRLWEPAVLKDFAVTLVRYEEELLEKY